MVLKEKRLEVVIRDIVDQGDTRRLKFVSENKLIERRKIRKKMGRRGTTVLKCAFAMYKAL